jgi:hypothetical protein
MNAFDLPTPTGDFRSNPFEGIEDKYTPEQLTQMDWVFNRTLCILDNKCHLTYTADYRPSNRDRALAPRYGFFWCVGCDRQIVRVGGKCRICGTKHLPRRLK